jgi:hypothetical protein
MDKIEILKTELRGIISRALIKRADTKQINASASALGNYIQANTDTILEIEAEILKIIED